MEENKIEQKFDDMGSDVHEENIGMAIVAYFLFFIPLLTDSKDDPFVKFHVKQSLVLFCLSLVFYILRYLPIIDRLIFIISPFISVALLILLVIGIVNAINSKRKELPLIGQFADRFFKF